MARKAKNLKVTVCHDIIFEEFKKFKDPRPIHSIKLTDMLMSSLAVFSLKCPSLLNFENRLRWETNKIKVANLKKLFRLEKVPSDTQLRDVLDCVDYSQYRPIFKNIFSYIQRSKTLENFEFMKLHGDSYYLAASDGTGYFRSEKISCDDCLVSEHFDSEGNLTIKYGHNMLATSLLHPEQKQVIPFYPEAIVKQDGLSKNDSEQTAYRRFLEKFKQDHPKLKIIFLLDALYANGPIIRLLRDYGYEFIIAVKKTKSLLFLLVKEGEETGQTKFYEREFTHGQKIIKTTKLSFRYKNNVRLHQDKDTPYINFVEVLEEITWINTKGKNQKKVQKFSFITDIKITTDNVEKLSSGGRARWKIENETFNTLKNRGYHFEHSFGHGELNLSYNFIMSMFLSFLVDQVQEMSCRTFTKAIWKAGSRTLFWFRFNSALEWINFESWDELYNRLAYDDDEMDTS